MRAIVFILDDKLVRYELGQMTGNAAHGAYIAIGDLMQQQAYIPAFGETLCTLGAALIVGLVERCRARAFPCCGPIDQKSPSGSMAAAQTGNFIAT
jgi:hypothetical protein